MSAAACGITANAGLFEEVYMHGTDILVQGGVKTTLRASGSPLMVEPLGVAAHLEVPPTGVDIRHMLALSLENEHREPMPIARRPSAVGDETLFLLEWAVDVFGPVPDGLETLRVPWCTNLHHIKVPEPGLYRLVLSIDQVDTNWLDFEVVLGW